MFSSFFAPKKQTVTTTPKPPKISIIEQVPQNNTTQFFEPEYDGSNFLHLKSLHLKIVVMGASSVGKSTIIEHFVAECGHNTQTQQVCSQPLLVSPFFQCDEVFNTDFIFFFILLL